MNFCPNCGGKIDIENAKFCSNCGFNFQEKKERSILKKELRQNPEKDFYMAQPDNYKVIKLSPQISEVVVRGETIDYVVEKNTETIEYEIRTHI
jgi:uncharacterized membrane protein YvbJ